MRGRGGGVYCQINVDLKTLFQWISNTMFLHQTLIQFDHVTLLHVLQLFTVADSSSINVSLLERVYLTLLDV